MKKTIIILTLSLLLISCGSNTTTVIDNGESNKTESSRILQVVYIGDDIYHTDYEYNSQNLISHKKYFYNNVLSDIEDFTYNENRQLISKRKYGVVIFYSSNTSYSYGDVIYEKSNLPTVTSSDTNYTFRGGYSFTHIDYTYDLNEQNIAYRLNNTHLYHNSTLFGEEKKDETVTNFIYDTDNRVVAKNDDRYNYNELGQLISSSNSTYNSIYNYDDKNRLSDIDTYRDEMLINTVYYDYESGVYDDSSLITAFPDEEPYIS